MSDLKGQTVVIIGGSSGMGLGAAQMAATQGATVIIAAHSQDKVNLFSQAHGLWAALPHLKSNIARGEPGGAIICFSSVLGQLGHPMTSAYCASKHGLNGMVDALQIELKQQNLPISVTTIMPRLQ